MKRSDASKRGKRGSAPEVSEYRGRNIEVYRGEPFAEGERGAAVRLVIDGKDIAIERTEHGYMSHENMFRIFSSPHELAESIIRQWGDAEIRPATHRDHPHDHDERGGGGHHG